MELQSVCGWFPNHGPNLRLSSNQLSFPHHHSLRVFSVHSIRKKITGSCVPIGQLTSLSHNFFKQNLVADFRSTRKKSSRPSLNRGGIACVSNSNKAAELKVTGQEHSDSRKKLVNGSEPFRGKSGTVSFSGLTHQLAEEGKLVSAPFKEGTGSFLWLWAPIALISSLLLPQFFVLFITDGILMDETLSEILASFSSEVMFYLGLATFLRVTDKIQKPYLQFSPKRWSLITGLRGYLTTSFFIMGSKVFFPLFAAYVTWPVLGLPALVSVAPFLASCLAQLVFEKLLDKRGSSCWPLLHIIFEVYRIYQLSKAAHFIEKLMFAMKGLPTSPEVLERGGALAAMIVTFQVLGMVCLWSLLTFLQRLFPSRPVAENY